jgi:hypothetical protein
MNCALYANEGLGNTPLEFIHDDCDVGGKQREQWDNRLRVPPSNILERYLGGDLAVLVELFSEFVGQRRPPPKVCPHISHQVQQPFRSSRGMGEHEFAVLIDNVHSVDNQERIAGRNMSIVRLEFLDQLERIGIRHALYLSIVTGRFVFRRWSRLKNGELGLEKLSPEELADFADWYCPCGKKNHNADNLKQLRLRFKKAREKTLGRDGSNSETTSTNE